MSNTRKTFDREFKLRAVEMSYGDVNISDLAKELGVRPELLYRWRSQLAGAPHKSFPGHGNKAMTAEEAEVQKLKKQLADKEMELEILKKAIGIFSRKDGKSIGS